VGIKVKKNNKTKLNFFCGEDLWTRVKLYRIRNPGLKNLNDAVIDLITKGLDSIK
jgi:hypothetical protein